ncbi:ATP-dependent Clp protease ATP-binding subunit [Nonomuraea sp. NBC_01738]|uniref:Clp protease N-terminal domain-containing protein n=1 Tax=Nonomuraea sp. NBC_01738 TaxID=2976003 RepID=UPI002E15BAD9|nr:ATP-dependent Clp protease ATP-binding subunit [Nonomuraea sp. NBC_01738]
MDGTIRLDDLITAIKSRHPNGDPLGQLTDAVTLGEHLGDVADHLIGHFVDQARHSGASWTEIGRSMGVTKQAAQKRFVVKEGATLADDMNNYARFTDRARRCVVAAQEEARATDHDHIEPQHVMLGLLHEPDALAARAMVALGADLGTVGEAMRNSLGPATGAPSPHVPFSAGAKKVLELTLREGLRLGHNYIGTEHILLGVLSLTDEPAVVILEGLGVTKDGVEEQVLAVLAELTKDA